jgi:uncharacterized protein (TIGR02145 family)
MNNKLKQSAKAFFLLTFSFLFSITYGQSPQGLGFQGVVRDASNNLVINQVVGMQSSILQGTANGTVVFAETQTPATNGLGIVSVDIGSGTVVSGDFSAIDWANGPYFIKTEFDLAGGINYSITATSQLLSVPYALHAKTAETFTGSITETDPVYSASEAANITATDITNLSNLSGTNTGDQDISGIATNATAISTIQSEQTTQNTAIALNTAKKGEADGTASGQMKYWNGTAWVTIAVTANEGATLQMIGGVPTWTGGTPPIFTVTNPTTGAIWIDRNLGASQVATSSTDAASYGDLYQWGRAADGHQIRTSGTTATLSNSDTPGHGDFITNSSSPYDWRNPQNDNLWQGVSGTNNPCPSGYRLPTEAEWEAERTSWSSNDAAGAFASPLKLPLAGSRDNGSGSLNDVGSYGSYWSSTVSGTNARYLDFESSYADFYGDLRAIGFSVRCIKD